MSDECDDCGCGQYGVDCYCTTSCEWCGGSAINGVCEKCSARTWDDAPMRFTIEPPKGYTFASCDICHNPFCYDGTSTNCLCCEMKNKKDLNKEVHD